MLVGLKNNNNKDENKFDSMVNITSIKLNIFSDITKLSFTFVKPNLFGNIRKITLCYILRAKRKTTLTF